MQVPYAVIGGFAVHAHGLPRPTDAVDFIMAADESLRVPLFERLELLGFNIPEVNRSGWVNLHGVPRSTFALDIGIEPTVRNADRLLDALRDVEKWADDSTSAERMLKIPSTGINDRLPVDVMSRLPGVRFAIAWKNREVRTYEGVRFAIFELS